VGNHEPLDHDAESQSVFGWIKYIRVFIKFMEHSSVLAMLEQFCSRLVLAFWSVIYKCIERIEMDFNPLTPNDLQRRRAVSALKIKISSKNMHDKPTNTPLIHSVY
jgi:hypothetical protein